MLLHLICLLLVSFSSSNLDDLKESDLLYDREMFITKENHKNERNNAYFFNGAQMWYVKKYKPNKKQPTRGTNPRESEIIKEIFEFSETQIREIERELNGVEEECDTGLPYLITIKTKGTSNTYSLKMFSNCYPKSTRHLMNLLEELFND